MKFLASHESSTRGTFDFPIELYYVDKMHPRYEMPFHWHMEFELMLVLSGEFSLLIDGRSYLLHKGDAAIISAGAVHGGTPSDCVYECVVFDMNRFLGSAEDDLVLRSSPLAALHKNGICDKNVLSKAEENSLLLCVGQGGYEGDALADTQALADTLSEVGFPCHLEVWGGDVSHDWYWWGKEFGMFAERLFG